MRINKYLSACELGSRRKVEEFVKSGKISINDTIVSDLAFDVKDSDIVKYNGKILRPQENKVYIMLNKPKCYITSLKDEKDRRVVIDLLKGVKEKVFPVGRLDFNTEGLLLLTNDGEWANRVIHPSNSVYKTYQVKLKVMLNNKEISSMKKGLLIDGIRYLPADVEFVSNDDDFYYYNITIMEGKNREIRRIFEHFKVKIYNLRRLSIGGLNLGDLPMGKYKYLNDYEKELIFGK